MTFHLWQPWPLGGPEPGCLRATGDGHTAHTVTEAIYPEAGHVILLNLHGVALEVGPFKQADLMLLGILGRPRPVRNGSRGGRRKGWGGTPGACPGRTLLIWEEEMMVATSPVPKDKMRSSTQAQVRMWKCVASPCSNTETQRGQAY